MYMGLTLYAYKKSIPFQQRPKIILIGVMCFG